MEIRVEPRENRVLLDGIYHFGLSKYPEVNGYEKKLMLQFADYERAQGRKTYITFTDPAVEASLQDIKQKRTHYLDIETPDCIVFCHDCKQLGCKTNWIVHTTGAKTALKMLQEGRLLSLTRAFNQSPEELAQSDLNTAGNPPDFFNYILFVWGNCPSGDRLLMEHDWGQSQRQHLTEDFVPGVRFYYDFEILRRHPRATEDGYHALIVEDELLLDGAVYRIVIPEADRAMFEPWIPGHLKHKVRYIPESDDVQIWNTRVYDTLLKEVQ